MRKMCPPEEAAEAVCRQLVMHPWFQKANVIMAYSAIPPEIDLRPVLETICASGKTLLLPRCEQRGSMTSRRVDKLSGLLPGAYGILEPPETMPIFPVEEIELILVPGLAFDAAGRRLGRGKGYYDRFLKDFCGKTMGICGQLIANVPVEPHDVIMSAVVTAEQIFYETEANLC